MRDGNVSVIFLITIGAILSGIAMACSDNVLILTGITVLLGVCLVILKWGVWLTIWGLFCLSIPWTMFRVPILGNAYNLTPAMLLALLSGIAWIIHARTARIPILRIFRPGLLLASLYIGFSMMSILWAPANSTISSLLRVNQYLFGLFVYVLFTSVLRSRRRLEITIRLILFSCGVMLIVLLWYYLAYLGRAYIGVWFQEDIGESGKNTLAYVLAVFFPLAASQSLLLNTNRKTKPLAWGLVAIFTVSILFATSRGTYLSSAAFVCLLLIYLSGRSRRRLAYSIVLGAFFVIIYQPTEVISHLHSLADILMFGDGEIAGARSIGNVDVRLFLVRAAWENFLSSPLWGMGFGSFQATLLRVSHNDYFRVMSEVGLIGLMMYISLFLAHFSQLLKYLWAQRQKPEWIEVGLFGAMMAVSIRLWLFNADTFYITWVALGLIASVITNKISPINSLTLGDEERF